MTVLGYEHTTFHFNDGRDVSGYYLYLQEDNPNAIKNVTGIKTERVFLSDAKINDSRYSPKVGDNIKVYYNRYGKVDSVSKTAS